MDEELEFEDAPEPMPLMSTGADGRIEVRTIRSPHYPLEVNATEPAHFHVNIAADGFVPLNTEVVFDDDPRLAGDEAHVGTVVREAELQRLRVRIALDWR